MNSSDVHLCWDAHTKMLNYGLEHLRSTESYSDVTLACDGKFFAAHKFILSICSDYFASIFEKMECSKPVIVLQSITCNELEVLLNFMYSGKATLASKSVLRLIHVAEELKIKGLSGRPCENNSGENNLNSNDESEDIEILSSSSTSNVVNSSISNGPTANCTTPQSLKKNSSVTVSSILGNKKTSMLNSVSISPIISIPDNCSETANLLVNNSENDSITISRGNNFRTEDSTADARRSPSGESTDDIEIIAANSLFDCSNPNRGVLKVDPDSSTVFETSTVPKKKISIYKLKKLFQDESSSEEFLGFCQPRKGKGKSSLRPGLRVLPKKTQLDSSISIDLLPEKLFIGDDDPYVFSCSMCNYGTDNKIELRRHALNHKKKKGKVLVLKKGAAKRKIFSCLHCPFRTNCSNIYKEHVKTHKNKISAPLKSSFNFDKNLSVASSSKNVIKICDEIRQPLGARSLDIGKDTFYGKKTSGT